MTVEQYWAPGSLAEALEHLRDGAVTILAGGTDLMPQSQAGRVTLGRGLLNVRRVPELHRVEPGADAVRIGALCTITELLREPLIRDRFGILAEACDHFASDQLRNAATIGGNLANASPAGDLLTPLVALDAEVELARLAPDGTTLSRRLPMAAFCTGPGRTQRAGDELITAVRVPLADAAQVARFYKGGTRQGLDISSISIALVARRGEGGPGGDAKGRRLHRVRLALGAVGPTPMRAASAEALLEGSRLDLATLAAAAEAAAAEARPIDDVRASAWYRRELLRNMVKRMLEDVVAC